MNGAAYKVEERVPVTGKFAGMDVVSAPAPFSGTTVIQMLEMAEKIDIADASTDQDMYLDQLKTLQILHIRTVYGITPIQPFTAMMN